LHGGVHDAQPTDTLAPLGRRLAAWLLDSVVLSPVIMLITVLFGGDLSRGLDDIPQAALSVFWLVLVAYTIGLVARSGQTIGKRWMRIRVADAVTGAVPNLDQSARRAVPVLIQVIPVVGALSIFLYLPALWRPRRQGLHDKLAGTVVVSV
jgi:uncharacterized RDD family membrane protein YckC